MEMKINVIIIVLASIAITSILFADLTKKVIVLQAGESIDLKTEVPWPVELARASYSPSADRGGFQTPITFFCEESGPVIVHGPTTVTLEYGSLPVSTSDAITSTPDAIGGGE
jgi:hypothetical protein